MNFDRYICDYVYATDLKDWNVLNCLEYLKDNLKFTSDSKQEILEAIIRTFGKVVDSPIVRTGTKKKLSDNIKNTFKRRQVDEFFEELDRVHCAG